MSDPVTNVEIEDVLSSIRRLVSEDARAVNFSRQPDRAKRPATRLVLTPALRVDPQDTAEDEGDAFDGDDTAAAPPGTSGQEPWSRPEATLYSAAGLAEDTPADAEPAGEPETVTPPAAQEPEMRLSDRAAALEAAVAEVSDEWEPDGSAEDAFASAEALEWEDHFDAETDAEPAPAAGHDAGSDEPMGSEAALRDIDEGQPDPVDPAPDLMAEDTILDEDSLRDLVAQIVREELQGELGERITRNVRKLVRREIHRALTLQDFD